jgi:dTDP-4-amino-4,6-dideoxygalactose transaminase
MSEPVMKITSTDREDRRRLAICGAQPRFETPRHVGAPTLPDRETLHARLDQMLDARRLTNDGPFVKEFESRLGRLNGDVEAVAVCNATVGMQLLLKALNLKGEVILPSFTFIATAHACLWEGLEPVFVDVERDTHTIDPACVVQQITDSTAAIIGVHLWGRMCRVRELEAITRDRGIPLVFDAAHGLGCTYKGVPMGRLGTASVVSFHGTKFVQSLEGGAILTSDRELADRLRLLRNFGFQGFDNVVALGTNAKMNEFCAAAGLGSLEALDTIVATNRANREAYREAIGGLPGLALYEFDEQEANNFQYVLVEVDPRACPFTRDELVAILHAENVIARRYFTPGCHRSMPYRTRPRRGSDRLAVTEQLCDSLATFPTGAGVTTADIAEIGAILRLAYESEANVRRELSAQLPRKAA